MKSLIRFIIILFFFGCKTQIFGQSGSKVYGLIFKEAKVVKAFNLTSVLGQKDSLAVQVTGQVKEVCQVKGCWIDVELADKSIMKVKFKDYAFFVPKDVQGKTIVLNGIAYNEVESVADQKHYAADAKKSKAEIAAITKPKQRVTFLASGVKIK